MIINHTKKSSLTLLSLISVAILTSQPVYSTDSKEATDRTSQAVTTSDSIKDLCSKSNDDLKSLSAAVQKFVDGKLNDDQLLTSVTEIDGYWNDKIRTNSCNSFRSNPITCPSSSDAMKQLAVSDSIKAMLTSINFQVGRKYAASEVKQFFDNGVESHKKLCQDKISN